MLHTVKAVQDNYKQDKPKFIKKAVISTGLGVVAIASFPYFVAGAGLALGFYFARKAVGTIEK